MPNDGTFLCDACGSPILEMVGVHQLPDDAYLALKGQWIVLPQFAAPVFVIDPDSEPLIVDLPNGQTAILVDEQNVTHRHLHAGCQELMLHTEQMDVEDNLRHDDEYCSGSWSGWEHDEIF